jgi:hypothetical protein
MSGNRYNPMELSDEARAMIVETSRQMTVREAEMKAEWEAKWEAAAAQRQADYEAMTPEEKAAHDEAMKPKPPLEVRVPADVTDEMIETADSLAFEDDRGQIDWEMTIDRMDGWKSDDGQEWIFPNLYDDPVFEKIKRGVRKMRRDLE